MKFQYGFFPLVCFSHLAAAHGGLKILGGLDAVNSLKPRKPAMSAAYIHQMKQREREASLFEREQEASSKNMRCGTVNGTCPTGYW